MSASIVCLSGRAFHRGKLEALRKTIKNDKITACPGMRCCHGNGLNPENES